jgi:hypothetical protein
MLYALGDHFNKILLSIKKKKSSPLEFNREESISSSTIRGPVMPKLYPFTIPYSKRKIRQQISPIQVLHLSTGYTHKVLLPLQRSSHPMLPHILYQKHITKNVDSSH